jgi:HD-like signal output (HDOD) protein
MSVALESIPIAHQFLASPIDPVALTIAIERTVDIQQRIVQAPMRATLGSIDHLPSPPTSVVELNRALARPEASIEEVATVVENDVAMSAKLLQLVNSAFFGLTQRVTNVRQATALLGLTTVRNLLIAVEMVRAFNPREPELTRDVEMINAHSLAVAEATRSLMADRHQMHDAFAAGMMHDIGLLAIMAKHPDRYIELRDAVRSGVPLEECETTILGAHHSDIGAYLLGIWGLPHSMVEAVARSHDADSMHDRTMNTAHAVFIAEQIVNMQEHGGASWENPRLPDHDYLFELGVNEYVTKIASHAKH